MLGYVTVRGPSGYMSLVGAARPLLATAELLPRGVGPNTVCVS